VILDFGYYPFETEIRATDVTISPLLEFEQATSNDALAELFEGGWCYAPPRGTWNPFNGERRLLPYRARVFGLPKTHRMHHARSDDVEHLRFVMHCLGFFEGMRFDDSGAGFLDATPVERGKLNDFALIGNDLARAIDFSDAFWMRHRETPVVAKTLLGVFQSMALSCRPQAMVFEEFLYAYTALEGCCAIARAIGVLGDAVGHAIRLRSLCEALSIPVPVWLTSEVAVNAVKVRNLAVHEGLFLGEPYGFAIFHMMDVPEAERHMTEALPSAMQNLVCRILVALLGLPVEDYRRSSTYERVAFLLRL
jgi:hypothetical protein